jgi:hypothetical protein
MRPSIQAPRNLSWTLTMQERTLKITSFHWRTATLFLKATSQTTTGCMTIWILCFMTDYGSLRARSHQLALWDLLSFECKTSAMETWARNLRLVAMNAWIWLAFPRKCLQRATSSTERMIPRQLSIRSSPKKIVLCPTFAQNFSTIRHLCQSWGLTLAVMAQMDST